jgi:hypothetical protein
MDELLKPQLQRKIESSFAKKIEAGDMQTIGIIKGVIPAWIKQLQSGQFSENEKHQALGDTWEEFQIREENREKASDWVKGFLYGIEAAGVITEDESKALIDEVNDIRMDDNRDSFLRMLNNPSMASVDIEE